MKAALSGGRRFAAFSVPTLWKEAVSVIRILKTAALVLALALSLSACGLADRLLEAVPREVLDKIADAAPHQASSTEEAAAAFLEAVDARDAEAAKALFAPSALEAADIDGALETLFELYEGPTDECRTDTVPGISKHLHYGRTTRLSYSGWVPLVSQGVNYYCYVVVTEIDDDEPENIGINKVVFATERARCALDFERPEEGGLWVFADPPGADYETCRIGEDAYVYTPVDRTMTKEEVTAQLEDNASWEVFSARFGEPNVTEYPDHETWNIYYYRLAEEEGEPRWARILQEDGTVTSAILMGLRYHSEDTLWSAEE